MVTKVLLAFGGWNHRPKPSLAQDGALPQVRSIDLGIPWLAKRQESQLSVGKIWAIWATSSGWRTSVPEKMQRFTGKFFTLRWISESKQLFELDVDLKHHDQNQVPDRSWWWTINGTTIQNYIVSTIGNYKWNYKSEGSSVLCTRLSYFACTSDSTNRVVQSQTIDHIDILLLFTPPFVTGSVLHHSKL